MRRVIIGLLFFAGVVMHMPAASAATGVNTKVTGSVEGPCIAGTRVYTVDADVKVTNGQVSPITLGAPTFEAVPGLPTVTLVSDGGLMAGALVPASSSATYSTRVTIAMPCGAQWGSLVVSVPVPALFTTYVDGDDFLSSGTPVSVGAIGGGILALGLGAALYLRQRKHEQTLVAG